MNIKKFLSVIVFVISIIASSSLSAEQGLMRIDKTKGEMSKEEFQKMYAEYLNTEGYKPEIDKDGDIYFKYEGNTFYIAIEDKDPQFFRIFIPQVLQFEEKDLQKILVACDYTTGRTKVAKVSIVKDFVWVSAETLLPAPDQFKLIFKRALGVCQTAKAVFLEKIHE